MRALRGCLAPGILREVNVCVSGHSGLELVIRVIDVDLDPVDERDAFLVSLHALRRKLRRRGDERDASLILLSVMGVGGDDRMLPEVNSAKIGFRNVRTQPDMIEIGQSDDGAAGRHHFSQLGLADRNDSRRRSTQYGIAEIYAGEPEIGLSLLEVGAGNGYIFLAAALECLVVALLCGLIRRLGPF